MPKNSFQDFVKIKRPEKEQFFKEIRRPKAESSFSSEMNENMGNKGSKHTIWFVTLISIIFLFFAVSFLFSSAKIFVDPKTEVLDLNQTFSAVKSGGNTDLAFDLISINGEEDKTVTGGTAVDVANKAEGTVILYNAYSTSSQSLSINSKLEGSNGKIYQIKTKIIIPGMKTKDLPGSVEVDIYGAEPGEEYNSVPLDFKILSFKGTSKYLKFYGRSKGEIKGGLKGKFSQISDSNKSNAITELTNNLQTKLLNKAISQIPSGYILFKDAVFLETDGGNIGLASLLGLVPVSVKGTLYGFIFNENQLTKKVVADKIDNYNNDDVYLSNIQNLNFTLINKDNVSYKDVESINFSLIGTSKIIWNINKDKLIADLLGKSKKEFNQIMSGYSNISSASLSVKPIWKSSLPDKSDSVQIIINPPK